MRRHARSGHLVAGVVGKTAQAVREAEIAVSLGYDAALLSLAALRDEDNRVVLDHCRRVAEVIPIVGFYLQPAVGGRILDQGVLARFLDIERVVAIKVAPFDRYRRSTSRRPSPRAGAKTWRSTRGTTMRSWPTCSRRFRRGNGRPLHFSGGLLGQWAVWTERAVEILRRCHAVTQRPPRVLPTVRMRLGYWRSAPS